MRKSEFIALLNEIEGDPIIGLTNPETGEALTFSDKRQEEAPGSYLVFYGYKLVSDLMDFSSQRENFAIDIDLDFSRVESAQEHSPSVEKEFVKHLV